jgi:hypothetical protein
VAFLNEAAESDWPGVHGFGISSPGRKIWGILTTGGEDLYDRFGGCTCASASVYEAVKSSLNDSLQNNHARMSTKGIVEKCSILLVKLIVDTEDSFPM